MLLLCRMKEKPTKSEHSTYWIWKLQTSLSRTCFQVAFVAGEKIAKMWWSQLFVILSQTTVNEVVHNAFRINSLESPEATTAFFLPLLNALEDHFVVTHGRTTIDDWNSPFFKTEDLGMEQEHFVNETYNKYLQYAYNACVFWLEEYFNLFPGD